MRSASQGKFLLAGNYPFRLAALRQATFPKGTAFGGGGKVSGTTQRRPLGGAGERSETEGVFLSYFPVFVHKLVTELCKRKWRGGMGICLW